MDYLKVKGHDGLVRDTSTGAIINTNTSDYNRYMKQKKLAKEKSDLVSKHSEDINNIKNELHEIKSMIHQLLANK